MEEGTRAPSFSFVFSRNFKISSGIGMDWGQFSSQWPQRVHSQIPFRVALARLFFSILGSNSERNKDNINSGPMYE